MSRQVELEALSKEQLHSLADGLLCDDPFSVERCVEFVVAETKGMWHGRARAMMCRRLKHCTLDREQSRKLVGCITRRLTEGTFSEQFKDQLRLAIHLNPTLVRQHSTIARSSLQAHVRRYGEWVQLRSRAE